MISPLWILKALLATFFVVLGVVKLFHRKKHETSVWWNWAEDFSPVQIKIIGLVEIFCAIGIVVPSMIGHGFCFTCISATGIALLMGGACFTHLRRHEYDMLMISLVFAVFALTVSFLSSPLIVIAMSSSFPIAWLGK